MVKNLGKNISKNLSGKYIQKLLDQATQSSADAISRLLSVAPSNRKNVIIKNCAPFTDCISEINDTR